MRFFYGGRNVMQCGVVAIVEQRAFSRDRVLLL